MSGYVSKIKDKVKREYYTHKMKSSVNPVDIMVTKGLHGFNDHKNVLFLITVGIIIGFNILASIIYSKCKKSKRYFIGGIVNISIVLILLYILQQSVLVKIIMYKLNIK